METPDMEVDEGVLPWSSYPPTPTSGSTPTGTFRSCVTPQHRFINPNTPPTSDESCKMGRRMGCVTPETRCLELITPPTSGENCEKPQRFEGETPKSHRTPQDVAALPRALKAKCRINVYFDEDSPTPTSPVLKESESRKRCQPEEDGPNKRMKRKPKRVVSFNLPTISEECVAAEGLKRCLNDQLASPSKRLKSFHEPTDFSANDGLLGMNHYSSPLKLKLQSTPKKEKTVGDDAGDSLVKGQSGSPRRKLKLFINQTTPKKMLLGEDRLTSPSRRLKLSIRELADSPPGTSLVVASPMKSKFSTASCTPRKLIEALEKEKENSPIKIDFSGNGWASLKTLILKPPVKKMLIAGTSSSTEPLDIIGELAKRNMYFIIKEVFAYLSPLELCDTVKVSKSWADAYSVVSESQPLVAKLNALTSKENLCVPTIKDGRAESRGETTPLKLMSQMFNNSLSPKRLLPPSPQLSPRTKRFCCLLQERKQLDLTQRLTKCPRCSYPARVEILTPFAKCSSCCHSYCVSCRFGPHPGQECNFTVSLSPSPLKRVAIGSKSSRKALNRLK